MRTALYGLVVDSDIPLHQDRETTGPADVTIRSGAPIVATDEPPAGRRLLHLETDRALFTAAETGTGYVLRFYRTCDFVIEADLARVTVRAVPGADPDRIGVLISGTLLSFLLAIRGEAVLHASAVQVGESALAFVGSSGMGKSTMATLVCAAGGQLITDDVLRLDLDSGRPRCHLGGTSLRLRKAATDLATLFGSAPARRVTGDGRDALTMTPAVQDRLPLAAIVIPAPQHESVLTRPELLRLEPKQALLALLQFPRIVGWEDGSVLDRQLQELGIIVASVPVYVARLPWGPPFSSSLAPDLLDELRLRPNAAPGVGPAGAATRSGRGSSSPDVPADSASSLGGVPRR